MGRLWMRLCGPLGRVLFATLLCLGGLSGCSAPRADPLTNRPTVALAPADTPAALRSGVTLHPLIAAPGGSIRLAVDPRDDTIYILNPSSGLHRIDRSSTPATLRPVADVATLSSGFTPAGMAFGPDGTLYLTANRNMGVRTQAIVRRGTPDGAGGFAWSTLATTEAYPASGTQFDHLVNGVAVSPDGAWVFVNSGSRTDHGEVQTNGFSFPELREAPLTARMLRLPAAGVDLEVPNDEAAQQQLGYLFARGLRNAYDLAFAPNGDLFAVDNGPDADFPDELNWIREGAHYGFPWRFGDQANPQATPGYDSSADPLLHPDFVAVNSGLYRDDPDFPPPPAPFVDALPNRGPDAVQYRAADGSSADAASAGTTLATFTPHRSPLGLTFADQALPADLRSAADSLGAFVLSWGAAGGTLSDKGQDLLFLRLDRSADSYSVASVQLVRDFANPIDSVLVDGSLYVLEFGPRSMIWEVRFES